MWNRTAALVAPIKLPSLLWTWLDCFTQIFSWCSTPTIFLGFKFKLNVREREKNSSHEFLWKLLQTSGILPLLPCSYFWKTITYLWYRTQLNMATSKLYLPTEWTHIYKSWFLMFFSSLFPCRAWLSRQLYTQLSKIFRVQLP